MAPPGEPSAPAKAAQPDDEPPDVWSSAVHAEIPEDAWEYQIRKTLNDAAYNGLDYVPYCPYMPIPKQCEDPRFMWKKKAAH